MNYKGKLYGKIAGKCFDTGKTSSDWDKLEERNKQANEFIIDIAKLLNIDESVGFDGITLSIDDFEEAIKQINKNDFIPDVINCTELEPEFRQALDDLCKKFNKPTKKRF